MQRFGLVLNRAKVALQPAHQVKYLGFILHSVDADGNPGCYLSAPSKKLEAIKTMANNCLHSLKASLKDGTIHNFRGRTIASLVGKIISLKEALPPARLATRALLAALTQLPLIPLHRDSSSGKPVWTRDYSAPVTLCPMAIAELQFWSTRIYDWNGTTWKTTFPSRILYTDASARQWGALLEEATFFDKVLRTKPLSATQGAFPPDARSDSVYTEAEGLLQALLQLAPHLEGQVVRHRTDNLSTYYLIKNGGSRSPSLTDITRKIWMLCARLNCQLQAEYVGKDVIIHVGADLLSRNMGDADYQLAPSYWRSLWDQYGPYTSDQFACPLTRRCDPHSGVPLPFYSRFLTEGCTGVDGLAYPWTGNVYAFPPPELTFQALERALSSPARATLIVCHWPSQPWWPLVLQSARITRVELGLAREVVVPGPLSRSNRMVEAEGTWQSLKLIALIIAPADGGVSVPPRS